MEEFVIRDMRPEDWRGKSRVHCQSWQETYRGIVDDGYLDAMSEEKCLAITSTYPENTAVAVAGGEVVGFVCWSPCREVECPGAGELSAIYVLDAWKGRGIGRALAGYCMDKLADYEKAVVWVLEENREAIGFYRHCGFSADGRRRTLKLGAPVSCIRMTKII